MVKKHAESDLCSPSQAESPLIWITAAASCPHPCPLGGHFQNSNQCGPEVRRGCSAAQGLAGFPFHSEGKSRAHKAHHGLVPHYTSSIALRSPRRSGHTTHFLFLLPEVLFAMRGHDYFPCFCQCLYLNVTFSMRPP